MDRRQDQAHQERVRQRAYRLWEEEGRPEGREQAHWEMAEELVAIEENQRATLQPVPPQNEQNPATGGAAAEPPEAAENVGEFPTMTDQGEQEYPPRRHEDRK